ncbi:MAG: hypothetical protein ABL962_13820 [Fimbriimonadaceae bacterium]
MVLQLSSLLILGVPQSLPYKVFRTNSGYCFVRSQEGRESWDLNYVPPSQGHETLRMEHQALVLKVGGVIKRSWLATDVNQLLSSTPQAKSKDPRFISIINNAWELRCSSIVPIRSGWLSILACDSPTASGHPSIMRFLVSVDKRTQSLKILRPLNATGFEGRKNLALLQNRFYLLDGDRNSQLHEITTEGSFIGRPIIWQPPHPEPSRVVTSLQNRWLIVSKPIESDGADMVVFDAKVRRSWTIRLAPLKRSFSSIPAPAAFDSDNGDLAVFDELDSAKPGVIVNLVSKRVRKLGVPDPESIFGMIDHLIFAKGVDLAGKDCANVYRVRDGKLIGTLPILATSRS